MFEVIWKTKFLRSPRLRPSGDLLIMGLVYYDNATYYGAFYELYASAEKGGGCT
jgi:hypothetical protein